MCPCSAKNAEVLAESTRSRGSIFPTAEPTRFGNRVESVPGVGASQAAVLGTSGGRLSRIIPHRSREERRLKARLTFLRVVQRELYAFKNCMPVVVTPTRAMRRVWDMGLYPQPDNITVLNGLWLPEHQA